MAITGLARSTITSRIEPLLASGLVVDAGEANSTGGRPPATFAFNPSSRVVLACDLGATHARMAITDLASVVLAELEADVAIADGPERVLDWVVEQTDLLLARAGRTRSELMSAGVGLPGPVEHDTGRPMNPPIMPGWDNVDVSTLLGNALGCAVLVDNDVNIMALGEYRTSWSSVSDLMFVKLATGIGAGIIADGQLRRGAQGAAGDIGHVAVSDLPLVPCRCGRFGCLEAVAAGPAIAGILTERGVPATTSQDVLNLVRSGHLEAIRAVRQAGRHLGSVLAMTVNLLNPSVIVLGGRLGGAGEHLLAGIREVVYERSLPLASQHLRIVSSQTGPGVGVVGASVMAIDHVLSAAAVDALVA